MEKRKKNPVAAKSERAGMEKRGESNGKKERKKEGMEGIKAGRSWSGVLGSLVDRLWGGGYSLLRALELEVIAVPLD